MTGKRIHWDRVDKLAIAEATIEHQRIYPKATILQSVRAAQQVLDESKQRVLRTTDDISAWIYEYMQMVRDIQDSQQDTAPEAPPEAPQTPSNALEDLSLNELTEVWLKRFFDEYIAPQIVQRANDLFASKMIEMIDRIDVLQGKKGRLQVIVPEQVRRQIQTKVLVLGLIGHQVTRIKTDFGDKLNLTFVGADHEHSGLIDLAKNCDVGVIMTRFINHSQQKQVRDNAPHTIMVSGSISDLSNILTSLVNEGQGKVIQHNFSQKTFAS